MAVDPYRWSRLSMLLLQDAVVEVCPGQYQATKGGVEGYQSGSQHITCTFPPPPTMPQSLHWRSNGCHTQYSTFHSHTPFPEE